MSETFEVEFILKEREKKGRLQYFVKWKDFPADDNTWEYADELEDIDRQVAQFKKPNAKNGTKTQTKPSASSSTPSSKPAPKPSKPASKTASKSSKSYSKPPFKSSVQTLAASSLKSISKTTLTLPPPKSKKTPKTVHFAPKTKPDTSSPTSSPTASPVKDDVKEIAKNDKKTIPLPPASPPAKRMRLEDIEKLVNPFKSPECKSVFLTPVKKPPPPPPAPVKDDEKDVAANNNKSIANQGTSTINNSIKVTGLSKLVCSSPEKTELPRVCGFDLGYEAEAVTSATQLGGRILLLIKWAGIDEPELVPSDIARHKCPQLLIQYYQKRLSFNNECNE